MKQILTGLLAVLMLQGLWGQTAPLTMPLNIQKAFKAGTRTYAGLPGPSYWINRADYRISADLNIPDGKLNGHAVITYKNNSPDTLKTLVIRLLQNITKAGNSRDWTLPGRFLNDGVTVTSLKINGDTLSLKKMDRKAPVSIYATNMTVKLPHPLLPGSSLTVETEWNFIVPDKIPIRNGRYDNDAFFVGYWYPQIAVYDDVEGWDRIIYSGIVEMYNDFSHFDVSVTVPDNFFVWGTGHVVNENEVYPKSVLKRLRKAKKSDNVVRILTPEDLRKLGQQYTGKTKKTWKFKADHVPDFAFVVARTYRWDAASVMVDPATKRRVLAEAIYPDSAKFWDKGAQITRDVVEYFSYELPGIPFPFEHITSFCNGRRRGGMEYPMMTNDGMPDKFGSFAGLIAHETAHSYFPFYMGTNERKYAWMDEGWANFLITGFVEKVAPERSYRNHLLESYLKQAGTEYDVPLHVPSFLVKSPSNRMIAYDRPAMAYQMLNMLLGDKLFKKALQHYMNTWAGKHPIPFDFFNSIEQVANEDLDWFWNSWFYEYGYPDLALHGVNFNGKTLDVNVVKVGKLPVPIVLTIHFKDGSSRQIKRCIRTWKAQDQVKISVPVDKTPVAVDLGSPNIPDVNVKNNSVSL